MTWMSWLSLCAICLAGAVSPGPSLAVVLSHTLGGGGRHGMMTGVCHALGVALWALVTVAGLSVLILESQALYRVITLAGAGYLVWLGVKALRSAGGGALQAEAGKPASLMRAGIDGFMISVLNPKLAVFFLALFSQFVSPGMSLAGQALMIGTAAVIDGLWYCLVALFLSRTGVLAWLAQRSRAIDRTIGVILLLLALRVLQLQA
ncbi:lysine transporter LysE [Marinobacterium aestuarii]|uniref:Lysine transporter LysE n=1 Tax=Marinobacterium aestuarii TaxID=1821621 RepID=A0A1A9F113_9GAMM|nr:LysE family translocator [Marinobacterium aestuarii]ANG63459.1 lysine transporter LysE [Marinobacterium aestuarii]